MQRPVIMRGVGRHIAASFVAAAAIASTAHFVAAGTDLPLSAPPTNTIAELAKLPFEQLMEQPVTTVARRSSTVGESAAAVTVITQEDIRRSGATTFPELLRRVPGMDVARIDASRWAVSLRGFQDQFANKLLVQMDGRTLYNPIFSGVYWDTVDYPLEDIERIEIVRGPGASVWGANAANGIINIITKPADETQGGLVSAGGGSEERAFGTIRYGGRISTNAFYRVYAKAFDRDETFTKGGDAFDQWWGARAGFRADWTPKPRDQITLQGDYFRSDARGTEFEPQPFAPFLFVNREHEIGEGGDILGRWTHTLENESSWTVQAYWDRALRETLGTYLRWDTYDVDFQHQFHWGERQRIVWGGGYRVQDVVLEESRFNGFLINFASHNRRPQVVSAFVEDQITVVKDRLTLTAGSKLEHNDFTGFEVQPTGRLLWTPTQRQSAWMAVSRAVVTPNFGERETRLLQPGFSSGAATVFPRITGNPGYGSESVVAYEAGYRAQVATNVSADLALFYNEYKGLGILVPGTPTTFGSPAGTAILPLTIKNGMDGETYGAELSSTWRVTDWWKLYGGYTLLQMQLHADHVLSASSRALHELVERQSPQQQVFLQSSWDLPGNVELDVMARYVDRLAGFNPIVNDYVSLDVRLGWRMRKNLMLEIVGQNLVETQHAEAPRAIFASPRHEIQRGVYGKVTWWF